MIKRIFKIIKNVLFSVLFFAVLLAVLAELSYPLRFPNDDGIEHISGFYALDENTLNVAFVGSSAFYRMCNTTVIYNEKGYTSYNYTAPAFPFEITTDAIKEIKKTQDPDLFVVDLRRFYHQIVERDAGYYDNENFVAGRLSFYNRIINNMPVSFRRFAMTEKVIPELIKENEAFDWQFEFRRTHDNWKTVSFKELKNYIKGRLQKEKTKELHKSEYLSTSSRRKVVHNNEPNIAGFKKTVTLTEEQLKPLNEIINYAKKTDTEVLFVLAPYPITEESFAYEVFLEDYIKKQDMNLLNFNRLYKQAGIDFYSDFYDNKHLNILGSYKCSKYLAKYFEDNYSFKPLELTDAQADEWKSAYAKWWKDKGENGIEKIKKRCKIDKENEG